jgi:hypothetical protein
MSESRGLFAVRRAETGAGADYYVAPAESADDLGQPFGLKSRVWTEGRSRPSNDGFATQLSKRLVDEVTYRPWLGRSLVSSNAHDSIRDC